MIETSINDALLQYYLCKEMLEIVNRSNTIIIIIIVKLEKKNQFYKIQTI